ncbi:hypothetical protein M9H77_22755 [Catharanthus roseus]|uniref:Uncharacterized protein n=1 Tax=Catharanthus roseus TaxID=4058 RepID=A0ACC0AR00_CATRO|nr:hypothetical protein M9H77_22755 [Catharanthus roseus]
MNNARGKCIILTDNAHAVSVIDINYIQHTNSGRCRLQLIFSKKTAAATASSSFSTGASSFSFPSLLLLLFSFLPSLLLFLFSFLPSSSSFRCYIDFPSLPLPLLEYKGTWSTKNDKGSSSKTRHLSSIYSELRFVHI